MNIGILINTCEPFYHGGYETRAWLFARELARRHSVRVFTSCDARQEIDGVQFVPLAPAREFFNERGVRNLKADLLFAWAVRRRLAGLLAEVEVLDINATPFLHLPAAAAAVKQAKVAAVATCHEALLSELPAYVAERGVQSAWMAGKYERLLAWVYRRGMAAVPQRIAVSANTAKGLETEGFSAMATVEAGLDLTHFPAPGPKPEGALHFVFVGRLTAVKRVEEALVGLNSLHQSGVDFTFDVAGMGSELPRLRAVAQGLGFEAKVRFHGHVSEERKRALLAEAHVFLMTSPREGFSVATMEAMASGCAVIAANRPAPAAPSAVTDYLRDGENGLLYNATPEGMALALRALYDDRERIQSMGTVARSTAETYDIRKRCEHLESVYTNLSSV